MLKIKKCSLLDQQNLLDREQWDPTKTPNSIQPRNKQAIAKSISKRNKQEEDLKKR